MVHTFAPAGLAGRRSADEGFFTSGPDYAASRVQLVNLAPFDQQISKGATICSAMVTLTRDLNCPVKNQLQIKERT